MRKIIIFCLFLSFTLFLDSNFSLANDLPVQNLDSQESFIEQGVVTKILSEKHDRELEKLFNSEQVIQILKIKILTGTLKNQEVKIKNYLTSNPEYDIKIKQGDRVIIEKDPEAEADQEYYRAQKEDESSADKDGSDNTINIAAKDNSPIILIALGLFLLLLPLVGGIKGLKTIAILGLAGLLIISALIPAILSNTAVLMTAISVALASSIFGIFLLNGFNIRSICAATGVSLSVILSGLLSLAVVNITRINNIDTHAGLILLNEYPDLNFGKILTSSVIISTLGALIFIGTTIANYIAEKHDITQSYEFDTLFKKGLASGKETVGAMISAIIFIYMGAVLPLLLLAFSIPFIKFINLGIVLTEFSAAITGSIAIILCSPITSAVTAFILTNFAKPEPETEEESETETEA